MTPPAIILDGRPLVGQCVPFAPKENGDDGVLSPDVIIGKLRGTNPAEVQKTLDYIVQNGNCNPRFIQPLLDLLSSNDPAVLGKAIIALMLMRENNVRFTPAQEQDFTRRLNGAQIQFVDGGLKITGKEFRLPNGAVLDEGAICFKDGQWLVKAEESAAINGVKIESGNSAIEMFFGGKAHDVLTASISIDLPNKEIVVFNKKGSEIKLTFNRANPLVKIEEYDFFSINISGSTNITIRNRDEKSLIPEMIINGGNYGYIDIQTGWFLLGINDTSGYVDPFFGRYAHNKNQNQHTTAVPIEVSCFITGKQIDLIESATVPNLEYGALSNHYDKRLVLNNYGQVGFLSAGEIKSYDSFYNQAPGQISASLNDNYVLYDLNYFLKLFPKVQFTGVASSENIKTAIDFLMSLPPAMKDSVKGVDFPNLWVNQEGGANATRDYVMHFPRYNLYSSVFYHEAAHLLTFKLETEGASFNKEWKKIAGYDEIIAYMVKEGEWAWRNGQTGGPRYGYIRPYGVKNYLEDIATFVEAVISSPDVFKCLTDSTCSPYDPRYKQKLDLLLEYGFITQEQYTRVTNMPEVKIDTVK